MPTCAAPRPRWLPLYTAEWDLGLRCTPRMSRSLLEEKGDASQSRSSTGKETYQYIGLERFGRIVDQRWIASNDVNNPMDRFQYGYDRDGNRLYKDNLLNNSFDELYHANGASNGNDNFNQITDFRRGALSDANSDGVPDTVTTSSRTQNWSFDGLGNWSTLTTDGTAQN